MLDRPLDGFDFHPNEIDSEYPYKLYLSSPLGTNVKAHGIAGTKRSKGLYIGDGVGLSIKNNDVLRYTRSASDLRKTTVIRDMINSETIVGFDIIVCTKPIRPQDLPRLMVLDYLNLQPYNKGYTYVEHIPGLSELDNITVGILIVDIRTYKVMFIRRLYSGMINTDKISFVEKDGVPEYSVWPNTAFHTRWTEDTQTIPEIIALAELITDPLLAMRVMFNVMTMDKSDNHFSEEVNHLIKVLEDHPEYDQELPESHKHVYKEILQTLKQERTLVYRKRHLCQWHLDLTKERR